MSKIQKSCEVSYKTQYVLEAPVLCVATASKLRGTTYVFINSAASPTRESHSSSIDQQSQYDLPRSGRHQSSFSVVDLKPVALDNLTDLPQQLEEFLP